MKQLIRSKVTFSNVIALTALFVALGGSAYAVSKNSVGTKQLRNNAVATKKIKNNAVTTPKIKNGAVTTPKLGNGAVSTDKLADGSVTTGKVADNAITGDKVDESTLTGVLASPIGPAGGDLAGTYPNPSIANDSITSAKIQDGQIRAGDLGTLTVRSSTDHSVASGTSDLIIASCLNGEVAIGGGGQWSGTVSQAKYIQASVPTGTKLWQTTGRNESGGALDFTAYALCLAG